MEFDWKLITGALIALTSVALTWFFGRIAKYLDRMEEYKRQGELMRHQLYVNSLRTKSERILPVTAKIIRILQYVFGVIDMHTWSVKTIDTLSESSALTWEQVFEGVRREAQNANDEFVKAEHDINTYIAIYVHDSEERADYKDAIFKLSLGISEIARKEHSERFENSDKYLQFINDYLDSVLVYSEPSLEAARKIDSMVRHRYLSVFADSGNVEKTIEIYNSMAKSNIEHSNDFQS